MSGMDDGFKRPKELISRDSLPKPPRQQLMDQLGLQEEDCNSRTSSSESEDEAPAASTQYPTVGTPVTPSRPKCSNEVDELKVILRETQRKLFLANNHLSDSSNSKERKLKIMKSSHHTAMALKEQLIQDLQDVVQEKDDIIAQLEGRNPPFSNQEEAGTKRLVERISQLHKEAIAMHTRWEEVCEELKVTKAENLRLEDELIMAKDVPVKIPLSATSQASRQIKELTHKVKTLELEKGAMQSSSQTEKELGIQVAGLQAQLASLQGEMGDLREKNKVNMEFTPQLQAENSRLKTEVGKLASEVTALRANEKQLLTKMEALDKSLKEKSSLVADAKSDNERLLLEISTARSKAASVEDAQRALMDVVKATEVREKAAVEECRGLRGEVSSLLEWVERERSSLQSKVDLQSSKSSQMQKLVDESSSRCQQLEAGGSAEGVIFEVWAAGGSAEGVILRCGQLEGQLRESEARVAQAVSAAVEQGRIRTAGTSERLATARAGLTRGYWMAITFPQSIHHSALSVVEAIADARRLARASYDAFNKDISVACHKICHQISGVAASNRLLVSKATFASSAASGRSSRRTGEGTQADVVVQPDRDDDGVVRVLTKGTWKVFDLDKVFGPKSTQMEVFSDVKDLVMSCMDGYHVCIFAYGQTGSGKTFTMEGTGDNPGINQRALLELFRITEERRDDWEYTVVVSVLEIYNEMVRDLLSLQHTEKLEIKQGPEGNHVPGVTQVQVTCLQELNEVFAIGHENRATGSTKMNIQSSRSHALLCVTVHGKCKTTGTEIFGKLNLIDLAGSERVDKSGSDGIRLQEAKHINKSLSALGDVIHSLKSRSQHIPYRNSKLTYLLQDSLSGDSKTLMVVQVSPVEKNGLETVCSLNFAQRVRAVELGQAGRKVVDASA
eukprot:Em0001g1344a